MAFCSTCGAKLDEGVAFCTNCGTKVGAVGVEQTPPQQSNAFSQTAQSQGSKSYAHSKPTDDGDKALMRAYITGTTSPYATEHNYEHYKRAFDKFADTGGKVNWNWGSFWVNGWNLMYRKSYLWGIVFILLSYTGIVTLLGAPIVLLLSGMFGDAFHYSRYKAILSEAKRTCPNDKKAQISYIAQKGGVNGMIIGIYIVLLVVLFAIVGCPILAENM